MHIAVKHRLHISIIFAAFALQGAALFAAEKKPELSPEEKFLREAPAKIADLTFTKKDVKQCRKYLKDANGDIRQKYAIVLSRYIRTVEKEPVESLELLGPWVADKEAFDGWEKAQSEKLKQAESEWKEKYRAADKEQRKELDENRPSGLLAPFPKAKGWKIDADNAEVAIEIARSHMDLNKYREALEIIDCVGKQFGDETRVLSAECAGDLMVKMQMYQKSIDWFEYALKVLNALKSSDGFYGEQVAINVRVKKN